MSTSLWERKLKGKRRDETWIQFGRKEKGKRTFVNREKTFVVLDAPFPFDSDHVNQCFRLHFSHFELTIIETGLRSPAGRPEGHRLL